MVMQTAAICRLKLPWHRPRITGRAYREGRDVAAGVKLRNDMDKIEINFKTGVLTATLPKKPELQKAAKKIKVRAARYSTRRRYMINNMRLI
jgi:hypothetical protein